MQAPAVLSDAPMENEEAVYPCKGCGEILEEGKAFELAGNRWHIDCFRCNTCGTLLDSDANLLLLGDGSLICNNCTYSCSACNNKIEDLAILTGDQAFCANCFKCRNCKRKIDNLRYARTSQGIFCMQCHESLMARRRKRTKAMPRTTSTTSNGSGPAVLDKSLPALPPHVVPTGVFQSETENLDYDNPQSPASAKREVSYANVKRGLSPSPGDSLKENMVLPPSTYGDGQSLLSSQADSATPVAEDDFFIPVTLDSADSVAPLSRSRKGNEQPTPRDYFAGSKHTSVAGMKDDFQDLVAGSSRSGSTERSRSRQRRSPLVAPHIASQQRGRKSSGDLIDTLRKQYEPDDAASSTTSPTAAGLDRSRLSPSYEPMDPFERDGFRLQDAPKSRPSANRQDSKQSLMSSTSNRDGTGHTATKNVSESSRIDSPTFFDSFESLDPTKRSGSIRRAKSPAPGPATLGGANQYDRPARDDSLFKQSSLKQTVTRKEVPRPEADSPVDGPPPFLHERKASGSSFLGRQEPKVLSGRATPKQLGPIIATSLIDGPPARSPRRPPSARPEEDSDIGTPRNGHIAPPSSEQRHRPNASVSSIQSEHFSTQDSLPQPSEDDINRMLPAEHQGLFRRVSKAVKHGRNLSEKNNGPSPTWKRNGSTDIGSPPVGSLDPREETLQLRNKLRLAQQRAVELESEKMDLQEKVNGNAELRSMNAELREKRSTMAFLDTQREMVIRELEVMTEHLSKVKDSRVPLDMDDLQSVVIRDFATSLQKLKDSLGGQIEDLMRKKNDTTTELSTLSEMKEKTYQEYETLSARNAQLTENNQQLLQSLQDIYKQSRQPSTSSYAPTGAPQSNGLGIFPNQTQTSLTAVDSSASHYSFDTEADSTIGLIKPNVVNIEKAQPKRFNWKKGGQAVAKNMTKGLKGAFGGAQTSTLREEQFSEGVPYGSIPSGELPAIGTSPFAPSKTNDPGRQWAFLNASAQKAAQAPPKLTGLERIDRGFALSGLLAPDTGLPIFGSDLAARCEYEKRIIPAIVSHCIEEVQKRGIALEGIYRKSGSSTQVKAIQTGFEKDLNYDISDPDLDIHAVTSTLKQYFRKLPNPLITFEVYDALLEAVGGDTNATVAPGMGMGGMGMGLSPEKGTQAEEEEKARRVREVVDSLPTSHRETLEFLIEHLVRVMEKESENLMTPLNIAVVFAPTIMRPQSIEREITDMQAQRVAVQLMLEQSRIVFGEGDD